jgi:hypothetical protein
MTRKRRKNVLIKMLKLVATLIIDRGRDTTLKN